MKVGFIGLGAMGGPMASNIRSAGFDLLVFDINRKSQEAVVAKGARGASSVAEVATGADLVITMLPATKHVIEVYTGPDGILQNLGSGAIVMDMSTIAPSGTDTVVAACDAKGIKFIDAPVGRTAQHAADGESLFMIGCDDEAVFNAVKPYLDAMGTKIIRCGGRGTGIRAKLVNNFQVVSIAQLTAEALVLASKLGVELQTVKDINADTSAMNGQMQMTFAGKVFQGDTTPGFALDLAYKDLTLALEAASELRLGLPSGSAAHAAIGSARSTDYADKDFTAIADYAAELADLPPIRLSQSRNS